MARLNIDSVIDVAKFNLGLRDTTLPDADLERLIDEGAHHMQNLSSYVVACETISIDCNKAELPAACGDDDVICFSFPSGSGCSGCCNFSFDPADESNPWPPQTTCGCVQYYIRNRNVLTEFCSQNVSCAGWDYGFDTQNGFLIFPSTITATSVKVWYRGRNIGEDGLMVIDPMSERGLAAYASWKYASAGQNIKNYQPYQVNGWKQEWIAQKNSRIATDFKKDAKANAWLFAAICRAILVNPANSYDQNL